MDLNKGKLYSCESLDEFVLHLPNITELVDNMIKNDNVKLWADLSGNIMEMLQELKIIILPKEEYCSQLFKYDTIIPHKIILLIMISRNRNLDVDNKNYLLSYVNNHEDKFTKSQLIDIEHIKYENNPYTYNGKYREKFVSSTNDCKKLYYKLCDSHLNYKQKILLDLDKLYMNNKEKYIEYIKWLIELGSLLQVTCIEHRNTKDIDKIFWHPSCFGSDYFHRLNSEKNIIMKKLLKYFEDGICKPNVVYKSTLNFDTEEFGYPCLLCSYISEDKIDFSDLLQEE